MSRNYYKTDKGSKSGDFVCALSLVIIIVGLARLAAYAWNHETEQQEIAAEQMAGGLHE
jgi:hypothetical protein|tara:strand:- start:1496 stop:1672 length:177 start_codon:yes stop_codon:yes gene_type:complete